MPGKPGLRGATVSHSLHNYRSLSIYATTQFFFSIYVCVLLQGFLSKTSLKVLRVKASL